jgi:hypothetical protein
VGESFQRHRSSPVRNNNGKEGDQLRLVFFFAWRHPVPKGPFLPDEFVPTEFSTAGDKAHFGNTFLHFIESDWKQSLFTKSFYNRLSMCFFHIAHYNQSGFYETWLTSEADRLRFLRHTLEFPCYGDPAFTFCDVERAIQREVRRRNYLALYELKVAEAVRSAEMEMLTRLESKYRRPVPPSADERSEGVASTTTELEANTRFAIPVQASLF